MKRLLMIAAILTAFGLVTIGLPTHAQNPTATPSATALATAAATAEATLPVFTQFNLNTATNDQILSIPNVNSRWLREFTEYRPYVSVTQFKKELSKYGVSAQQLTDWLKYVYVPISVDSSDAETLKQIPGVDDTIAKALIAARPFKTNEAFLLALAKQVTPQQAIFAANYLDGTTTIPADLLAAGGATAVATAAATPNAATPTPAK